MPHATALEAALGAPLGEDGGMFSAKMPGDAKDRESWPEMADWLHEQGTRYRAAFAEILEEKY